MPFACFCFGAGPRPGSPEAVAKKGGALGEAAALKVGASADENREPPFLIGTAVSVEVKDAVPVSEAAAQQQEAAAAAEEAGLEGAGESSQTRLLALGGGSDGGAGGARAATSDAAAEVIALTTAASSISAPGALQEGGEQAASEASKCGSPAAESSGTALLPPVEEVSLRQPQASHLSALLSCSSSGQVGHSGERRSKQQATPRAAKPAEAAMAAEAALLPRAKLLALAQPEASLEEAAGMLGRREPEELLAALLTVRRVAIHHHQLLGSSLEDAAALLLECLHGGGDPAVGQAAAMALLDLFISFGSAVLRVLERQQQEPQHSCLLGLLMAAALGRTPAIRHWANEALSWMAQRMAQARVIALLEPYLDHGMAAVRQKAAQHLMVATYRPPDRPTSPVRRG